MASTGNVGYFLHIKVLFNDWISIFHEFSLIDWLHEKIRTVPFNEKVTISLMRNVFSIFCSVISIWAQNLQQGVPNCKVKLLLMKRWLSSFSFFQTKVRNKCIYKSDLKIKVCSTTLQSSWWLSKKWGLLWSW